MKMFIFNTLTLLYLVPLGVCHFEFGSRQLNYCEGLDFGEFVANPKDCKHFYWCRENGEHVSAICPLNMLFNSQTKLCDDPQNVQCGNIENTSKPSVTILPSTETPTAIITTDEHSSADSLCFNVYTNEQIAPYGLAFLAHPGNCKHYYMCYRGQALLHRCSSKLHWNAKYNKCDLPSRANCLELLVEEQDEEDDVEVLPSDGEENWVDDMQCPLYGEHIFPNSKRCDTFIYCVKGQALLQICPFYYFFDVDSASCQLRSKSTCAKDINLGYRKRNF